MDTRKTAAAVLLVTAGMAVSAAGFAQGRGPDSGFYIGGSYGEATADDFCSVDGFATRTCDDNASAWKFFAGYQVNRNLAIEATYMKTDDFQVGLTIGGTQVNASADATAYGIAALGILPLGNFSLFGKLGIIKTEAEATASGGGITAEAGADETGLHYGIGAMYNFTRNLALRAEWEKADKGEFSLMSIGVQFKF